MATKIKSVEFDGDVLTVKAIVDNGFLQDEIKFTYDVKTDEISSDSPMNNTNGWMLLALLQNTAGLKSSDLDAVDSVEESLENT